MPGAGSHIIHLFIVYIHRMHHCPTDGDVKWWSRVSELYSGHVNEPGWLWLNSMSLCIRILSLLSFLCMHDKCVNIMTSIAYIVLKGRKTQVLLLLLITFDTMLWFVFISPFWYIKCKMFIYCWILFIFFKTTNSHKTSNSHTPANNHKTVIYKSHKNTVLLTFTKRQL